MYGKLNIKKIFTLSLCLIFINIGYAQYLSPVTQNIGGTFGEQTSYSLTFSVGEMVSTTHFVGTDNSSLSSGFLQSFTPLVTSVFDISLTELASVILSPNPSQNWLKFKMILSKPGTIQIQVLDINSIIKMTYPKSFYTNSIEHNINVEPFVAGNYYIQVIYQGTDGISKKAIYKFIKL